MEATKPAPQGNTTVILIALGLAVAAMIINTLYIQSAISKNKQNTIWAWVLARDVKPGEPLTKGDVVKEEFSDKFREAFKTRGALDDKELEALIGTGRKRFEYSAPRGELVISKMFLPQESDEASIPAGYTRIPIPVNPLAQPGTLQPKAWVDILGKFSTGSTIPEPIVVLERVQVQAVGSRSDPDPSGRSTPGSYRNIMIEVKQEDAPKVLQILHMVGGEFLLTLRRPNDSMRVIQQGGINPRVLKMLEDRTRGGGRPN